MKEVFCDTHYFVALLNPEDSWHERALELTDSLGDTQYITSQYIFLELLNFFSAYGPRLRSQTVEYIERAPNESNVMVIAQSDDLLEQGLELYKQRHDKSYSLTDCISMSIMRERRIANVLSSDAHFVQEKFTLLM
ncbi:MAG: type II toxin-antitoxin system VapC family toxin [Deltaproteobacteria bacterium]|nr:type II toxin-antitoxin system VapC family toxin [Deltaproteobacteria bacterium]